MSTPRTALGDFITWFTDNFVTASPRNITAAKMRDFGNRIASNTRTSIGFLSLTSPVTIASVDDTTPQIIPCDYALSSNPTEIVSDATNYWITLLISLFYGSWAYKLDATATLEGTLGVVAYLCVYNGGTLLAHKQVTLAGVGVPMAVDCPSLTNFLAASDQISIQLLLPTGASPADIIVDSATLTVTNLPGMV